MCFLRTSVCRLRLGPLPFSSLSNRSLIFLLRGVFAVEGNTTEQSLSEPDQSEPESVITRPEVDATGLPPALMDYHSVWKREIGVVMVWCGRVLVVGAEFDREEVDPLRPPRPKQQGHAPPRRPRLVHACLTDSTIRSRPQLVNSSLAQFRPSLMHKTPQQERQKTQGITNIHSKPPPPASTNRTFPHLRARTINRVSLAPRIAAPAPSDPH